MAALGANPKDVDRPLGAAEAVRTLTLDADSPASVTACVERAREGTKRVRDVVSREMWQSLNTLYLELDTSDLGSALRTGPVLGLLVRARALRALVGPRRRDDAARSGLRLPLRRPPRRGREHDAAHAAGLDRAVARRAAGRGRPGRGAAAGDRRARGLPALGAGAGRRLSGRALLALRAELPALGRGRARAPAREAPRRRPEPTEPRRRCCAWRDCAPSSSFTTAPARGSSPASGWRSLLEHVERRARQRPTSRSRSATSAAPPPSRTW